MSDTRYAILLTEAMRQMEAQLRDLDQIRARSSALIAATSVSTAFLGAGLVRAESIEPLGWVAIVLFAAALSCALWALAGPVTRMTTGFSPTLIEQVWIRERNLSEETINQNLAIAMEQAIVENEERLDRRRRALVTSAALLGLEIVVWLLELS